MASSDSLLQPVVGVQSGASASTLEESIEAFMEKEIALYDSLAKKQSEEATPAEQREVVPGLSARDQKFAQELMALDGDICARSGVCQKMMRELSFEQTQEYNNVCKKEKQEFRARWANAKLQKLTVVKQQVVECQVQVSRVRIKVS